MSGLEAAERACAVADRSDLGRMLATGPDLPSLLHRLSTADVKNLQPGEGRPTVLTSAKGRIVERLSVHHLGDAGVLLVAGPEAATRVLLHLRKFTFAENTGLTDIGAETFAFALLGPRWQDAARVCGIPDLPPYGASSCTVAGTRVEVARTNGFDAEGVLVVGARDAAPPVQEALVEAAGALGGGVIDSGELEAWRILRGLPAPGRELTEEHNPLEAGLRDAVSFTKGCYVGQEVVARLNTYGKVSRALVRVEFPPGTPVPAAGAAILRGGEVIGTITSAVLPPGRVAPVALAYVKAREIGDAAVDVTVESGGSSVAAVIARA